MNILSDTNAMKVEFLESHIEQFTRTMTLVLKQKEDRIDQLERKYADATGDCPRCGAVVIFHDDDGAAACSKCVWPKDF